MEMKIKSIDSGGNSRVGEFLVNRLLPNPNTAAIGPVVFLDHLYPVALKANIPARPSGGHAHPHRGIATFSYVLKGRLEHFDSRGNHATIGPGGAQWMKAGNGILHDEQPLPDTENGNLFHSLQFWINLPSKNKGEDPEYRAVQAGEMPEIILPDDVGTLYILMGEFGCEASPVKTFSKQFIYHLKLNPKSTFALASKDGMEYAAFVPENDVTINSTAVGKSRIVIFENDGGEMIFANSHINPSDVFVFGGEKYLEPTVAQGPFVMNSAAGIADAYRDFFNGKYGTINYNH
ncbi:MAG TPA: pirin family protein [Chryseolinea sp.]